MLIDPNDKKIHFGSKNMSDYTIHNDDKRKAAYIARHKKREKWGEINPGALSKWILWNKPTIQESIKDFEKRFNI